MLELNETNAGFSGLARLYKQLVSELFAAIELEPEVLSLPPCDNAFHHGLTKEQVYLVKGGMLVGNSQDKPLITWDEGDLILPDAGGRIDELGYHADAAVLLLGYDQSQLTQELLNDKQKMRRWLRLLMLQQALTLRVLAARTEDNINAQPEFSYFKPGETIIRQGDTADTVYSLFEGSAEVLVDDVAVGEVNEGEMLGAMALLTGSPRSATVRAKSRCGVVRVPASQFEILIRSNPTMIHRLLVDLASKLEKMNRQVVTLSG